MREFVATLRRLTLAVHHIYALLTVAFDTIILQYAPLPQMAYLLVDLGQDLVLSQQEVVGILDLDWLSTVLY